MDAVRIGLSLRALRIRSGLRQADLGQSARVPREVISEIERGRVERVSLADIERIAAALGAQADLRIRWRGEHLDRLLDEAHAATVAAMVARLRRLGWATQLEVSFSIWGERGSIDVLAWHPETKALLVVEVKSIVPDLQATLHQLDRKTRLSAEIGSRFDWRPEIVARLLVVAESPTSRGRVQRSAVVLHAALPDRGPRVRAWLRAPAGPLQGLLFLSNAAHAHTRRATWRRERVHRPERSRMRANAAVEKVAGAAEA